MRLQGQKLRNQLAAEYVLGTMSYRVRQRFEYYMQGDPSLRIVVSRWSQQLNPLGGFLDPVRAPKRVWKGIERRLQLKTGNSYWKNLGLWRGISALATTAVLVLAIYIGTKPEPVSAPVFVAVVQNQQAQSAWLVSMEPGRKRLNVSNLSAQPIEPDKDFELWLLPANQQAPISLGLIHAAETVQLPLPLSLHAKLGDAAGVAVSLEPRGGSPTGAPTGPVLYQGAITTL